MSFLLGYLNANFNLTLVEAQAMMEASTPVASTTTAPVNDEETGELLQETSRPEQVNKVSLHRSPTLNLGFYVLLRSSVFMFVLRLN